METIEYKYKLQGQLVTIAIGVAGGILRSTDVELDSSYEECIGIEAHEVSDGGTTGGYYQIGVQDKDGAYVDMAHKGALLTSKDVAQQGKMRPVNFKIMDGRKLQVLIFWPTGNLASDLKVEMVFTLRKAVASTR